MKNKLIERKEYLDKLLSYRDKDIIKVVTGLRRSGKSTLLELFRSVKNGNGEIEYYQVSWEISSTETKEREFMPLETVNDNYPKFLLSTESFPQSRAGIIHKNVFEWLLDK
ncbi:MAG: hypothetical protein FWH18_06740 [Marinilabiliaceae bacterium]|nr:hypothetical protein [Marinilabiliaceae bacterium]